ncbi:MAG: class II aldolase/adducin family protein [Chloroflexi bacterium]|nr:class II aldolase/adducin family protein [Chloroflexota bacterium]
MTYTLHAERRLRDQICHIGRLMHQFQYIDGASGNISVRLDDNRILATPSGLAKGFMKPEELIVVDIDGNKAGPGTASNRDLRPTSEILMHLECYKKRPDVMGVVHAHPPTAVALTIAGVSMQQCTIPEAIVILGLIPTTPYATPSGPENRDAISELIEKHDAIMLAYHGSLTVGPDIWTAYLRLESLEHSAKILYMAQQLGGGPSLPPEQVAKLLEMREKLGLARPGDNERYCDHCGVCHPTGTHVYPEAKPEPEPSEIEQLVRARVHEVVQDIIKSAQ